VAGLFCGKTRQNISELIVITLKSPPQRMSESSRDSDGQNHGSPQKARGCFSEDDHVSEPMEFRQSSSHRTHYRKIIVISQSISQNDF
jgi:hypothetical protein